MTYIEPLLNLDDSCPPVVAAQVPNHIRLSIDAYVMYGRPVGNFLQAVLANDLMDAMRRADFFNRRMIYEICAYIHNAAPQACWGSRERYTAHVALGVQRINEAYPLRREEVRR